MAKIKVSRFETFIEKYGEYRPSKFMASDEIILQVKGRPIENTTIEIDDSELNDNYMYLPKTETP